MPKHQSITDQLTSFQQRDHFSDQAWLARGLKAPASRHSEFLATLFQMIARDLTSLIEADTPQQQPKEFFSDVLEKLPKDSFDTEESEYITDLLVELSDIVKTDIRDELTRWIYGDALAELMKKHQKQRVVLETTSTPCTQCHTPLEAQITRKRAGIPESWTFVQCISCGQRNLLSQGPDIDSCSFVNCGWLGSLPKGDYTLDQAQEHMQTIKQYGK